jgi:hypothetical protein
MGVTDDADFHGLISVEGLDLYQKPAGGPAGYHGIPRWQSRQSIAEGGRTRNRASTAPIGQIPDNSLEPNGLRDRLTSRPVADIKNGFRRSERPTGRPNQKRQSAG